MEKDQQRYEIVKELFLPCTDSLLPRTCEIEERQLSSPWDYVRALYPGQQDVLFSQTEEQGNPAIEVTFDSGQRHKYTFHPL